MVGQLVRSAGINHCRLTATLSCFYVTVEDMHSEFTSMLSRDTSYSSDL